MINFTFLGIALTTIHGNVPIERGGIKISNALPGQLSKNEKPKAALLLNSSFLNETENDLLDSLNIVDTSTGTLRGAKMKITAAYSFFCFTVDVPFNANTAVLAMKIGYLLRTLRDFKEVCESCVNWCLAADNSHEVYSYIKNQGTSLETCYLYLKITRFNLFRQGWLAIPIHGIDQYIFLFVQIHRVHLA